MRCEISGFGQLFHFFVGLEGVIFHFEQSKYVFSCAADEMGLRGTDGDGLCAFYRKIADSQASASTNI